MPQNKSPVLVLIHGLLSTPQEFALLRNPLKSKDIIHFTLNIPGFSEHSHYRPNTWHDWVDAAAEAIEQEVPGDRQIVIAGLCIGGVLAAALALRNPRRIIRLALLSPAFTFDGWGLSRWRRWRHLGYLLGISRFIHIAEREPYGIKNPKIRRWVAEQMRDSSQSAAGPSRLPLWAIREGDRMIAHVHARLGQLRLPTLILHAREDEICKLASVRQLFERLPAADKRLVILENSYHMISIDNDRHRVADELAGFVIDHIPQEPRVKLQTTFAPSRAFANPSYQAT